MMGHIHDDVLADSGIGDALPSVRLEVVMSNGSSTEEQDHQPDGFVVLDLATLRRSDGRELHHATRAVTSVLASYSAMRCLAARDGIACRETIEALDLALEEVERLFISLRALRNGVAMRFQSPV